MFLNITTHITTKLHIPNVCVCVCVRCVEPKSDEEKRWNDDDDDDNGNGESDGSYAENTQNILLSRMCFLSYQFSFVFHARDRKNEHREIQREQ